ncbi:MAG: hypothetical protein JWP91_2984 [Fibrobacteres bacterium]|nr:hypothetical protein [Fibrobacterota bacterium]
MILAMVGTKAFKGVIANQKETAQVKALTDAVTVTAEGLSALTVSALTEGGSKYLSWSAPENIGSGEYRFRYRTFPTPSISGAPDTSVVGLQVEIGNAGAGAFVPSRSFATLIAPHLNSRDKLGKVSTAPERAAEAAFYSDLQARIQNVTTSAIDINQLRLNSFSCYDKGQCCGFMESYFKDQTLNPQDGLDEKCLYRCAMAGDVKIKAWNGACGTDFCALAPWKTKESCCAAIAAGTCKPGSICANVCIDCLGEDGSTCNTNVTCDDGWWNDFFDCGNNTLCNGQPIPDIVPEWGNVKAMCKTSKCAVIPASCGSMVFSCCSGYWQRKAGGLEPWAGAEICATLTTPDQCCNSQLMAGFYEFQCSADGKVIATRYYNKNIIYCGAPPGSDWDRYCRVNQGCPATFTPSWVGGCGAWPSGTTDPWADPDPSSGGVHSFPSSMGTSDGSTTTTGGTTTTSGGKGRTGSDRSGTVKDSKGGRE